MLDRLLLLAALFLAVAACGDVSILGGDDDEGNRPGECTDRADNDSDGLFDCDDPGCATGPDCCPDDDEDGVCDDDDNCDGGDDEADEDGDGVADFCDPCPLDANDDSDGDGVCDGVDLCDGGDDALDEDGDGVADFCDPCPADADDDSDGDGFCDSEDFCAAVELDGNDGWVASPLNPYISTDILTGSAAVWFRGTNDGYSIFSDEGWIEISIDFGGLGNGCSDGACTNAQSLAPVNDGRWHHLVVTWDPSSTSLHVDGIFQASVTPSRTPTPELHERSITTGKHSSATTTATLDGQVSEVAHWSTVLSQSEIEAHRDGTGAFPTPELLWWRFGEGSGPLTADDSGNLLDGSFENGATWSSSCHRADADGDGIEAWLDPDDADPGR